MIVGGGEPDTRQSSSSKLLTIAMRYDVSSPPSTVGGTRKQQGYVTHNVTWKVMCTSKTHHYINTKL
jgi:hypothetical protein